MRRPSRRRVSRIALPRLSLTKICSRVAVPANAKNKETNLIHGEQIGDYLTSCAAIVARLAFPFCFSVKRDIAAGVHGSVKFGVGGVGGNKGRCFNLLLYQLGIDSACDESSLPSPEVLFQKV
jgi:hypothetical protein